MEDLRYTAEDKIRIVQGADRDKSSLGSLPGAHHLPTAYPNHGTVSLQYKVMGYFEKTRSPYVLVPKLELGNEELSK